MNATVAFTCLKNCLPVILDIGGTWPTLNLGMLVVLPVEALKVSF